MRSNRGVAMSEKDGPQKPDPASGQPSGKQKRKRRTLVRKTRYLALEQRIVFDGALAADIVDKNASVEAAKTDTAAAEKTLPAVDWAQSSVAASDSKAPAPGSSGDGTAAGKTAPDNGTPDKQVADDRLLSDQRGFSSGRTEIVFVDTTVRDFSTLLQGINPNTRVVMLDSSRDAIAQIGDVLGQYESGKVDAVHLITHGNEGQIDFGSGVLNATTMRTTYAEQLAKIGEKLGNDADILVYGCDFGKGEAGRDAAAILASLTGADVAASTNATGDAALGGDWNLELQEGKIESDIIVDRLAQDQYHDLLAVHTLDFDSAAVPAWTAGTAVNAYTDYMVDGSPVRIKLTGGGSPDAVAANPVLSASYTGGVSPAQKALQFTIGDATFVTITIDFSLQPGGTVSNVGFALYDVDNAEYADFSAVTTSGQIAATNVATSAYNAVDTATAPANTTRVRGSGSDSTSTTAFGNTYVYFNTTGISSVTFTYNGTANTTLVVLNDITFFGAYRPECRRQARHRCRS